MPTSILRPLNAALQKVAIDELNEVPERIHEHIETFRTWINQQPHLKARTDDQFLVGFLRGCKWSMEKAKSKIDKFYAMKTKYPELFNHNDVDDPKIQELMRLGLAMQLPTPLNESGPRIFLFRMGEYNPDEYTIDEVVRFMGLMHEITILEDDYALINGFVAIMDLSKATSKHLLQMSPSMMKKMAVFSEEALPIRQKASHFIFAPSLFERVFNTLKPMFSKKQQNRMFVHGSNLDAMYENIPRKYLAKEYGGQNGSIDEIIQERNNKLMQYREYHKDNANYGTDERLRVGKPIDFDSLFGIDGSFRKLNVD